MRVSCSRAKNRVLFLGWLRLCCTFFILEELKLEEVSARCWQTFGMDPEDESCQPKLRRQLEDVDYVLVEFEGRQLSWQDMVAYKPPTDALFAPRFRACVPPGMHRFRGNIWGYGSKPKVMQALGYPLQMTDRIPEITDVRNIERGLGLQDLVMAECLLMKHLDAPGDNYRKDIDVSG